MKAFIYIIQEVLGSHGFHWCFFHWCAVIQLLKWNNNHYFTFNYSNFASKTFEFGVATNLDTADPFRIAGFVGNCDGFVLDFTVGASINIAFWSSFDSIPGSSTAVGLGVDIPFTDLGMGISWVMTGLSGERDQSGVLNGFDLETIADFFDITTPNPYQIEVIGLAISIGLPGVGISAVDLSFHDCYGWGYEFDVSTGSPPFSEFKVFDSHHQKIRRSLGNHLKLSSRCLQNCLKL